MKKNIIFVAILSVIVFGLLYISWSLNKELDETRQSLDMSLNNGSHLNDSINIINNRNGELIYEKVGLYSSVSDLEVINKTLYDDIKSMKLKDSKNSKTVTELRGIIDGLRDKLNRTDTMVVVNDSTYSIEFSQSNSYRDLRGYISFNSKSIPYNYSYEITKDIYKVDVILVENDGKIFAKSNNNSIDINTLNIYNKPVIINKPKRFSLGIFVGPGLSYSYVSKNIEPTITIGIGLNFDLINIF